MRVASITSENEVSTPLLESSKLTEIEAIMAIIKSFVGAAILAMPFAFEITGYIGALLCIVTASIAVRLSLSYIIEMKHKVQEFREQRGGVCEISYPELAFEIGGLFAHRFTVASLVLAQVGCICAYHIFISRSIDGWIDGEAVNEPGPFYRYVPVIVSPILVGICLFVHWRPKNLAPVSTVGNAIELATLTAIIVFSFLDRCDDETACAVPQALNWKTIPITLGIAAFAMEGIFPVFPIEHSMENPKRFSSVLLTGIITAMTLCVVFGFAGSYIFGSSTASVITLNMTGVLGIVVKLALSLALTCSYPIQLYPVIQWTDQLVVEKLGDDHYRLFYVQQGVAALFIVFTTAVATVFPHFGNMLSLVGSIGFATGGILTPCVLYIRAFPDCSPKDKIILGLLFLFGLVILIAGVASNIAAVATGKAQ